MMTTVLSITKAKELFNTHAILDIQLIEVGTNQTKLAFLSHENFAIETESFDDEELETIVDFILASKSQLRLGC